MAAWIREILLYKWYDTPDGEDCIKKMIYLGRMSGIAGMAFSYFEVGANRHLIPVQTPTGYAIRFVSSTAPFVAAGVAFGGVTCLMCSARKKDDFWNYFWGGMAAGGVVGVRFKSGTLGTVAGILFGFMAAFKKQSKKEKGLFVFFEPSDETVGQGQWQKWRFSLSWQSFDKSLSKYYEPRGHTYYFPSTVGPFPPAN
ncbi:NADH dehydrogenase [ubiquinone] 1 alpha subcomplex subunit 11-like [Paramacrobiotus metropolitanus]|uniref:NADH dehydrogenase [ubiquinone] 1 alpha subcomplex subunit 11-like n=1 Tax=Paramacrobiotus metropolitanus TaxID=2943436 RepID=UPI00244574B5|nr:NADH dehydrogenase [ubiquinone] 1 alpha subcomplex subunit 11-like [Paramacrobiotus metropolitanus]